jgi:hypothetical protein
MAQSSDATALASSTVASAFVPVASASAASNAAWKTALQTAAPPTATGPLMTTTLDSSPATAALNDLRLLSTAGGRLPGGQVSGSSKPAARAWFRSQWFIQPMTALGVFILCFILLVAIRPPFLFKKQSVDATNADGTAAVPEQTFSTGGAALFALGATVLCIVCMVIFVFIQKRKTSKEASFT